MSEIVFDQVQIGKGLKPLAQHGFVVLSEGRITLLGTDRQVIAEGPIAEADASFVKLTRKRTIALTVGGERLNVAPGWGSFVGTLPIATGSAKNAALVLMECLENGGRLPE